MKKVLGFVSGVALVAGTMFATTAGAGAKLPDNCTKEKGVVTCTESSGPGNNQGGVGNETTSTSQGNDTNTNPQGADNHDYSTDCTQNPPKAQGKPIACP